MAKKAIPTIDLIDCPYLSAKTDSVFSDYVAKNKGTGGVDFLNTAHPYSNIVNKLQAGVPFGPSDIADLGQFTANVDTVIKCNNFVNNFKQSKSLNLPVLFNEIVKSNSYEDFRKLSTIGFTSTQKNALPYLFSIIKHSQDPNSYPINYKQWVNLNEHCKWATSGKEEYDRLCELYESIGIPTADVPKHLYFAAYMEYLAYQLMNIIAPHIKDYSKTKLQNLFNTYKDEIDDLLNGKGFNPQGTSLSSHPLNLILYGPPGTGKTYNTLFKALEIINNKSIDTLIGEKYPGKSSKDNLTKEEYKSFKEDFDKLVEAGQIVFTTFHQSMSYEDFIEGIKPIPIEGDIKAIHENDPKSKKVLFGDGSTTISNLSRMKYDVRDGIFKKIADSANKNRQESEDKDGKIISVQKLLNAFCDYAENNNEGTYLTKDGKKWHEIVPRRKDNEDRDVQSFVIKYGSGQHLTFSIINRDWESFKRGEIKTANDIKPKSGSQPKHGNAKYYFALYKALEKFEKEHKLTQQKSIERLNYVLIIDEINRGNVAQIFGELITLIEPSKRLGNDEEMTATLPYSSTVNPDAEPFGVPNNLYIIGTMNTADRSVEALDTALRRRFSFEEMMPDYSLLENETLCEVNLGTLLKTINDRIIVLKDREHQIGHSYFMGLKTDEELKDVFKDKIIPLLQEYFYGDYKKIYYVLGPGFVENSFSGKNQDSIRKELFPFVDSNDQELDISEERYEIRPFNDDPNDKRDNKVVIKAAVHELINSEEYQKKEKDFKEKHKGTTFKKGDGKKIDVKYVIERTFGGENISDFQEETV